jgi:hypothetical protein
MYGLLAMHSACKRNCHIDGVLDGDTHSVYVLV